MTTRRSRRRRRKRKRRKRVSKQLVVYTSVNLAGHFKAGKD